MMARLLHTHSEGAVMLCGGVRLTDGLTAALEGTTGFYTGEAPEIDEPNTVPQ